MLSIVPLHSELYSEGFQGADFLRFLFFRKEGTAHLNLEVYCPPYKAPEHGSVWYKGKEYRDWTLGANRTHTHTHTHTGAPQLLGITARKVWQVCRFSKVLGSLTFVQ